jgi:hypothetical protein
MRFCGERRDWSLSEGRIFDGSTRLGSVSSVGAQKTVGTARNSFGAALKKAKCETPEFLKSAQKQADHGVTLTKHASLRLAERGITLTTQDKERISALCEKEKEKYGGNDQIGLSLCGNVFVVFPGDKRIKTVLDANGKDGIWVDNIKGFYFG